MTSPGGGSSLGSANAKVRVTYQSTGAAKVVKDVQTLKTTLSDTAQAASDLGDISGATAKDLQTYGQAIARVGQYQKAATHYAEQYAKAVQKGADPRYTSKMGGLAKQTAQDVAGAKKVVADWQKFLQSSRGTLKAPRADVAGTRQAVQQMQNAARQQANAGGGISNLLGGTRSGGGGGSDLAAKGMSVGKMFGKGIAGGVLAAGASITAAAGYVLTKGFQRLTGLDSAAIKLKALGYETGQIAAISKSASESVDGLSFSLDQAFNAAASGLAAGVQLKDIDKYLKAIANTASLAEMPMDELGETFARAASQGKLTGEITEMLSNRTVPIFKLIAQEYGVTQAKAREMVTNNEVDFNKFIDVMSQTGDAGKIMGNTLEGSMGKLKASISKVGAVLLAPLFGDANGEISTAASLVQNLSDKVKELEKFLKAHKDDIIDFWVLIGDAVITTAQVVAQSTAGWIGLISQLIKVVSGAARVLAFIADDKQAKELRDFADSSRDFGDGLYELGKKAWGAGSGIGNLRKTLENFAISAKAAKPPVADLGDTAKDAAPAMQTLGEALEKLQIKPDAAEQGIKGTVAQFKELMKALKDKKASQELLSSITKLRQEWTTGGRAAQSYTDAIDNLSDSTLSASDKAGGLIDALKQLGLLPGGDALAEYNKALAEMTDYSNVLADSLDTMGSALLNVDGTINTSSLSKNADSLYEALNKIQQETYKLAASGDTPVGEVFDQSAKWMKDVLAQFQIVGDEADKVINTYLSPGGKGKIGFEAQFQAGNAEDAIKQAFGDEPGKIATLLDILTKPQDIINEITGGPGSKLKIPAELDMAERTNWWGGKGSELPTGATTDPEGKPYPTGVTPAYPGQAAPPTDMAPGTEWTPGIKYDPNDPGTWPDNISGRSTPGARPKAAPPPVFFPAPSFAPPNPTGKPGPLQITPGIVPSTPKNSAPLTGDQRVELNKILSGNADLSMTLTPLIEKAEGSGQSLSDAFADGIANGSEEVKAALLRLAQLAPDILGSSPAKYGPLSGKGWTLYRGKTFTQAYAEGIESEAGAARDATSSMASAATLPFGQQVEQMIGDLQQLSDFGKLALNFGNQIAEIGFSVAKMANDFSGGRLFPKSYKQDPNAAKKGSRMDPWNPTRNATGATNFSGAAVGPGAKGDPVASAFIAQAQAAGLNQEQILAGLGVLNQETRLGTNPNTNNVQNQNGTAGITGVFQQDMSYRKYGDPRDPNVAIKGFIDQFINTGDGLSDPNPWKQALDVQRPATVGNKGYDDRGTGGNGAYLRDKQRAAALEIYNRLVGGATDAAVAGVDTAAANISLPQSGGNVIGFIQNIAKQFDPELNTGYSTFRKGDPGYHGKGLAVDIDAKSEKELANLANFIGQQFKGITNELIYSGPDYDEGLNINSKEFTRVLDAKQSHPVYGAGTLAEHGGGNSHVHWAVDPVALQSLLESGVLPENAAAVMQALDGVSSGTQPGGQTNVPGSPRQPIVPGWQNGLSPLMPQALEGQRDLLGNRPKDKDSAVKWLQDIDGRIADQNRLGDPQSKLISDQLGSARSSVMSEFNMQEGPSALDQAQQIYSGVSGIAGSAFDAFDAGLKYVGALKDTGDLLVRGISNTDDVMRLIDNFQTGLEYAQKIVQVASDVASFAGSMTGGMDMGITSGVGGMLGVISQVIGAINTGIDLAQEGYKIVTKYAGRFLTSWLGFPGASDMKFLLDTVTGQLNAYTSENPLDKHQFNTLGRQLGSSRYGDRPPVNNQWVIYQGPGQDPRDTMDDAMFTVRASGMGVFGAGPAVQV